MLVELGHRPLKHWSDGRPGPIILICIAVIPSPLAGEAEGGGANGIPGSRPTACRYDEIVNVLGDVPALLPFQFWRPIVGHGTRPNGIPGSRPTTCRDDD